MNDPSVISFDALGFSGRCHDIRLEPDRAFDLCSDVINVFYRDRYKKPALLVVGFDAYINLSHDTGRRAGYDFRAGVIVHPTEFMGVRLLIDDTVAWSAKALPEIKDANPDFVERPEPGG